MNKKRGRPVGSKNKPKKVIITKAQADLAKKLGIPLEDYAKELVKKPIKKTIAKKMDKPINWEKLARELQAALRDEIHEGMEKDKKIKDLEFQVRNLAHQAIGYQAVVSYLENKLGNATV